MNIIIAMILMVKGGNDYLKVINKYYPAVMREYNNSEDSIDIKLENLEKKLLELKESSPAIVVANYTNYWRYGIVNRKYVNSFSLKRKVCGSNYRAANLSFCGSGVMAAWGRDIAFGELWNHQNIGLNSRKWSISGF